VSVVEDLLQNIQSELDNAAAAADRRDGAIGRMQTEQLKARAGIARAREALAELRRRFVGDDPTPAPVPRPPVPVPPPLPVPTPNPVPVPVPPEDPGPFQRDSPAHRAALQKASELAGGIRWEVIESIEEEETGNYEAPEAKAWLLDDNPGGMIWSKFLESLGAKPSSYGGKYGKFINWLAGILGHGRFLGPENRLSSGVPRYAAAHATSDPYQQVIEIGAAGYAAGSAQWVENVTAKLRRKLEPRPAPVPIDAADYLTPHFRLSVDVEHLAAHPGNFLPASLRGNALAMAQCLERVREKLGGPLKTNSWYRSAEVNGSQPGSSSTSKHLVALAVDLSRTEENWNAIHAANVPGTLLQIENGSGGSHYHLQLDPTSSEPLQVKWLTSGKEAWE
jgi:hypothetical protein